MSDKIKVLIVDDSRIFRGFVEESLSKEIDIAVIGSVRNGIKALEFIRNHRPDIVTLDVEMPDMDGLETLKAINEINLANTNLHPIGVIMISSFTKKGADITIKALEQGAFDFIAKPESANFDQSVATLQRQITVKIRTFSTKKKAASVIAIPSIKPSLPHSRKVIHRAPPTRIKAILIGVSTGGPSALNVLMPFLCQKVSLPIFIVQHMPPTFTESLANSLDSKCDFRIIEAKNNQEVLERHAYIAPGGKHLLLRREKGVVVTSTNEQPQEKGCRPSVDILFRSASHIYGGDVIAIILTGMGNDGTSGIGVLKRAGAYIIAQDKESSVVWGMPGSAVESGNVDAILSLKEIPAAVEKLIQNTK